MTTPRTRSILWSAVISSVAVTALAFSAPAFAAAKKAKPAAVGKKKPPVGKTKGSDTAKDSAVAKALPASTTWEAPPRDAVDSTPPAAAAPAATAEVKPAPVDAGTETPPAPPPPAPAPAPAPEPEAKPAPAPAPETEMPSFGEPAPKPAPEVPYPAPEEAAPPASAQSVVYVEHLGPSSYPGKRGLDGGSLALEPSFDGLQWPVMTRTGLGLSGSIWVDSGYVKIGRKTDFMGRDELAKDSPYRLPPTDNTANTRRLLQQSRAVLRVTPTYASGDFFLQAQAELVLNNCQSTGSVQCDQQGSGTVDTDDLWVRVGHWNIWDLKLGRFEGWELYHTGMGMDINTLERKGARFEQTGNLPSGLESPPIYTGNFLHDRPNSMGAGYGALHFYAGPARVELLGKAGTDQADGKGNFNWGFRPSLILDFRYVKLKYGVEYEKVSKGSTENKADPDDPDGEKKIKYFSEYEILRTGQGGSLQFVFDPYIEFGANVAKAKVSQWGDTGSVVGTGSYTQVSYGGFANVRIGPLVRLRPLDELIIGGGYNYTWRTNEHKNGDAPDADFTDHIQAFGALQYRLAKKLYIKLVVAYANAEIQPTQTTRKTPEDGGAWLPEPIYSSTMWSGRVRLMYLY